MELNGKLTRRDFSKLCAGSTAALSLALLKLPDFDEIFAEALQEVPVIWIQGASDSGCSVSICNAVGPTIQDLLLTAVVPGKHVNLRFHQTLMAGQGHVAMHALEEAAANPGFILVVEGSIPTKDDGIHCLIGEEGERGITMLEHLLNLSKKASAVVALGTCSAFGGIPAAEPNVTGVKPVDVILKEEGISTPVINLPGCPPHPDWFTGTVAAVLIGGLESVELDELNRPTAFYGKTIHDQCPRRGQYEAEEFATKLGESSCLYLLGCKGPVTYADCSDRLWNNKSKWCVESNAPCAGCAHPGYPDKLSPLYEGPEVAKTMNKVAAGLGITAAVAGGAYAASQVAKKISKSEDKK